MPDHVLWGLCRSKDIEVYWLAGPDESGVGAVHLQEPAPADDQWPFTFTKADGGVWMGAISFYRQLLRFSGSDPARPIETLAKAALSQSSEHTSRSPTTRSCSTSPGPTPATATR